MMRVRAKHGLLLLTLSRISIIDAGSVGATYFELAQRRRSASCQRFETLAGALSGHAELGADDSP